MTPARPRYLLLDIGMVLVGLDYQPLADRMCSLAGIEPTQLQSILSADDLVQKYETGKITDSDFFEEACRRIGMRIPWPEFLDAWYSVIAQPLISDELLATLARNVHLWALSNTNKLHFEFMMRQFSFLRHFEGFVLSHEVGALKPDTRFFLHALERIQAPVADVLFVDDQETNVKAAQALGMEAFRFRDPEQFAAEMESRGLLRR